MSQMDKKIAGPSPENSRYVRNRVTGVQTIQKPSMKMVRKQLRGISRLSHSTIKRLPRQEIFGETCFFNTLVTDNGRFLRHRFSTKPKVIASQNSLPKRNHVAKKAVSAAWQTETRQWSERICKPNDASKDEAAALRKNHVMCHLQRHYGTTCRRGQMRTSQRIASNWL